MPEFDREHFQALLHARWCGRNLEYHPTVGSTMDRARELANEGCPEGAVVLADEQTAGRGRKGRAWVSPPGANLYFTVVLHPDARLLPRLALAVPLAVRWGCWTVCQVRARIKWPNDVVVGTHKLAGVLIDAELSGETPRFALAGVGLNVNFDPANQPEVASVATSLLAETGRLQSREAVLAAVLEALERRVELERQGHSIVDEYRDSLAMLGEWVELRSGDTVIHGKAVDIAPDGALVLRHEDGREVAYPAGELSLRPFPRP